MAPLPPIQASTVTAINAAWEASHKNFDSTGLSISALGSDCDRALWYTFRHASDPEQMTGQKLRRFETGNVEETRLIADLRRAGMEVLDVDPDTGRQFKVYALGGHVRGKLDGEVYGVPEAPKTWHVVECKSHNDKSFKELVKKGVRESKPGHYRQCLVYMHARQKERCLYLAVNKNTDEIYAERLRYDPVEAMQLVARLERIIQANRAPSRISDDASKWPCILCEHKAVCHGDAFGRPNCRTCIHSTPCIDEGETWARWHCGRFAHDLSTDEQRAGCHAHLYLPDLVPGEQSDAGDDWVAYAMRDGSTWTDRVKPEPVDETDPVLVAERNLESMGVAT